MLYIIFETCVLHFSELDFLTNIGSVFVWERNNYHFNCSKIKWLWSQFAFCMVATNKPKKDTLHCLLEKKRKKLVLKFPEIELSYTASISTQTKKTKNTLKDCIYLKESSLFVNDYTCCIFWLLVVFYMSVCKQTTFFNCRWLTSHLTLKFMLGDVLWRT